MPNMIHSDITGRVLELITERPMTSHDIRITLGRSREHIARLMKKLSQEGLVERNTESKPYSYSISNTGKERLEIRKIAPCRRVFPLLFQRVDMGLHVSVRDTHHWQRFPFPQAWVY